MLGYPIQVCFLPYANVLGSIIQCGHDGHIADEYSISITFFTFTETGWLREVDGKKYLRIPYNLKSLKYKITCVVAKIINQTIKLSTTFIDTLRTSKY